MRPPRPVQRFVAPDGSPPKARMGPHACARHTQHSAPWPKRDPQRRSQWDRPHAPAGPNTAIGGTIRSPTEGPSGAARTRPPRGTTFRGRIGGPIECRIVTARVRSPPPAQRVVAPYGSPPKVPMALPACVRHAQCSASWPRRELHRRSQWDGPRAPATPSMARRAPLGGANRMSHWDRPRASATPSTAMCCPIGGSI
eukprot:3614758-Pyramimonas_sp.AAC.1